MKTMRVKGQITSALLMNMRVNKCSDYIGSNISRMYFGRLFEPSKFSIFPDYLPHRTESEKMGCIKLGTQIDNYNPNYYSTNIVIPIEFIDKDFILEMMTAGLDEDNLILDEVILNTAAILHNEKPIIECLIECEELSTIRGEFFIKSRTIVLKELLVLFENEKLTLMDYAFKVGKNYDANKLEKAIESVYDLQCKIADANDSYNLREEQIRDHNLLSSDNIYYNDQLDMDQQSPEFWDNV